MEERSVPVIACSTGASSGGALAVIRISGFESLKKLSACFSGKIIELEVRKATLVNIVKKDTVLDSAVVTFFKAPHSYTGENLLEISVHGNPLNVKRIMEHLSEVAGLEPALPGEFTFRAYKNGKLTLSQVEGLDILLRGDSPLVLDQGIQLLQGDLHRRYLRLHKTFLDLKGAVELSIDFLEDVGEEAAETMLARSLSSLKEQIEFLYQKSQGDYGSLLSPSVVLWGRTNAGKSSLFNALLDESRSIVSEEEGTTRDFVSEYTSHKDVHYRLVDTAGMRATGSRIEQEGIRRARELLKKAFFKILVINPFDDGEGFFDDGDFDLVVATHGDRPLFKVPVFSDIPIVPVSLMPGFAGVEDSEESGSIGAEDSQESGSMGATVPENGPMGAEDSQESGSIGATVPENGPMGAENSQESGSIGATVPENGPMGAEDSQKSGFRGATVPENGSVGAEDLRKSGSMGAVVPRELVKKVIWGFVSEKYSRLGQENPILIDRHSRIIKILREKLFGVIQLTDKKNQDIAIVASEILSLEKYLYSLIGAVDNDEVFENIFDNFCIGK